MIDADLNAQIDRWLADFCDALNRKDAAAATALFDANECFWRDLAAFTWNITTLEGRAAVDEMLRARLLDVTPLAATRLSDAKLTDGVVEARIEIETNIARGQGYLRLRDGRCWTLLTTIMELKAFPEPAGFKRELGTQHGVHRARKSWLDRRREEEAALGDTVQPYCLIIGGGQNGIALAARLRRLGVPSLTIERNARAGDSWRQRYSSLCLHDPVWYDHLPYIPFPDHWPIYTPKDKLGDWLEMYVKVMELPYWTSTTCEHASYDPDAGEWCVEVRRGDKKITLRPKHLVLATGMSGVPALPKIAGRETFKGEQYHSSGFTSGKAFSGKRCIIVGANNSAHDIAADLWENGAEVTMIQRSPTIVVRSETLMDLRRGLYSEEAVAKGVTCDIADLLVASMPYKLEPARGAIGVTKIKERDADLYDRLDQAGFLYHFGVDDSGIGTSYARRGSGYYIDVGASELIANGQVSVKSRVEIERISPNAVHLTDGTDLPADLIVYATGYGSMNGWAAQLINQDVADKVGKCWGLGSATPGDPGPWEGELRNMWKPTAQEGLWFQGGNLFQARFYSVTLALQLKARFEGLPTPVYGLPPVNHLQ